jgi:predicted PurR-regulated permease PerM
MTNHADPEIVASRTKTAHQAALGALCLVLVLAGLYTLWNFLSALAWAAIFAIALWPLYRSVQARRSGQTSGPLLPAAFTLAVALIFIAPITLVGVQIARESHQATQWVENAQKNGIPEPEALHHIPFGQAQIGVWWQANLADPGHAKALLERAAHGRIANFSRGVGSQLARRLTLFAFTLLTLYFLFKDGDSITRQMRQAAARAFGSHGERIGAQIIVSVHGTVNGLVLVGLGEGVALGIAYAVAGVPHPTLLGAISAVAAMIPFVAGLPIIIAALLLFAQGSTIWAIGILVVGFLITFSADHFIRPALIGGATKLPFLWVLLGILGGLEAWGLIGLFLGPAIMAALMLLWREWASAPAQDPLAGSKDDCP